MIFLAGGTKLERFLPKKQDTQRKLLNLENWCSGEVSKNANIWLSKSIFYVKNHLNFSDLFFIEEFQFQGRRKVCKSGRAHNVVGIICPPPPTLCVQMDFTRTYLANNTYNNINHVCRYFYTILVVLKYHRRLWENIFDKNISRCINTYIKVLYLAFFWIFMLLKMSVSKILSHRRLWYF